MLSTPTRARRGSALAIALVALVVVAALGGGAALAARESNRGAHDALAELRAAAAAEGAVESVLARWARRRNQLRVGASDSVVVAGDPPSVVRAARLDRTRILVEGSARARASAPGATSFAERTVSVLARLEPPEPAVLGALTVGGALQLLGDAVVDGADAPPAGWADCPPPRAAAAIAMADVAALSRAPTADVRGAVVTSAAAASATTYAFLGREAWESLAARADSVVDGGLGSLSPDVAADSFPLVVARNGLTLDGPVHAQGTLLVDGDLTVRGGVTFVGTIVVRGALHASAGALRVEGAVLVASGASALGPGSHVTFSRCAIARAADGAARVHAERRRSWAQVTR